MSPFNKPRPRRWPLGRWATAILLVFGGQLGLIFWLSIPQHVVARRVPGPPPSLQLAATRSSEMLALTDPTLFALPHREGFSGPAWFSIRPLTFEPFVWSEGPRWLDLNSNELGAAFCKVIEHQPATIPSASRTRAEEPRLPELAFPSPFPANSSLHLSSTLARRGLSAPLTLRPWTHTDILTNSVVQVLLDEAGRPVSCTLLPPGSGWNEADAKALALARSARFQPVHHEGAGDNAKPPQGLTVGQMVFEWHTLLVSDTNLPAAPK
jgi:hypothetical protein